jgi:large subunit ribosomal protein L24
MKLSQGDSVIVTAGKDKGKKGSIMRVLAEQNRVIVSGVNMVTKHVKKTTQEAGKKIKYEVSLHASNVAILDPKTGKATRVGYKVEKDTGKKTRFAKASGVKLERSKVAPEAKPTRAPSAAAEKSDKKSPFWKKVGFGSDAVVATDGAKPETAAPTAAITSHRSAGRGS